MSVSNILPILKEDGTISNLVQYELAGLSVGTGYWISVRASFQDLNATNSFYVAQAATYGRGMFCEHNVYCTYMYLNTKFYEKN